MPHLDIAGKNFSYTIVRKPVSALSLRLKTRRSFIVTAPRLTPNFIINRFIAGHQNWILKNSANLSTAKTVKINGLKTLIILDIAYQLNYRLSPRDSVVIFPESQLINVGATKLTHTHLKTLLDKKLRPLALKLINENLRQLAALYGFKYHRVTLRNQSSRYGSCSSDNNLNFNWQIILFPYPVFQHILLHELTHLTIKDHSSRFWHQLAAYDPHCGAHRFWLKKEGNKHLIFS